MNDFIIMVDSACDLPLEIINENNIYYMGLKCLFKGTDYIEDCGVSLSYKDFYTGIREGEMPTTSQVNSFRFESAFEEIIKSNKDILYLSFSSALSGTMNSALIARSALLETHPQANINIIDTKSASLGYGLLVLQACRLKSEGMSISQIETKIKETIPKLNHIITMDDLQYLSRGGRLSGTAATLGTLLQLKPMVKINDLGQLINYNKVRGRKRSIATLFEEFEERAVDINSQKLIAICHSDCLEEAERLAKMVTDKYSIDILINDIGCVIGSHTGANTIAIFFIGEKR